MSYIVFDTETTYGESYGRVGNRWDEDFSVCATGWLRKDSATDEKGTYTEDYLVNVGTDGIRRGAKPMDGPLPMPDLTGVTHLVGHNIKFDLLMYWDNPKLIEYFKRGGKIIDTMYMEYLLSGQLYNRHGQPDYRINLKQCGKRRQLKYEKLDMVKALWDTGIRTEDISESILLEYLKYDVLTTDELFKAQLKQAREQGQIRMIQNSMDGLLATTEMEYNGIYVDLELGLKQAEELEKSLFTIRQKLDTYIPELPVNCEFKWGSWRALSALLFGGDIKYTGKEYVLDENGNRTYYKKSMKKIAAFENGEPVRYKAGKRAGEIKYKTVLVPDIDRGAKSRNCVKTFTLPRQTEPEDSWIAERDVTTGEPTYYSVAKDVIDKLGNRGIPVIDDLLEFRKIDKDLGTYYIRTKKINGKDVQTGMLTNVQPFDGCVHGSFVHDITATRRLSGSKPNLQNISKKGRIKETFCTRFHEGVIAELDYSQLEVVTQGLNSGDDELLKALEEGRCFHCEWLAFAEGKPYEEVYKLAKVDKNPVWVEKRQQIKALNFAEAYGAGMSKLSMLSGLDADVVKKAIDARMKKYHKLYQFHQDVEHSVQASRVLTKMRTPQGYVKGVGYYQAPTGTIYHFLENESPDFKQAQGDHTAFSPTTIKNYPSQGLGGEIMQTMMGLVWRQISKYQLQNKLKLVLTVHDSLYVDCYDIETAKTYLPKIASVLEMVSWYFKRCFPKLTWGDTPVPCTCEYGKNIKHVGSKENVTSDVRGEIIDRDDLWVNEIKERMK